MVYFNVKMHGMDSLKNNFKTVTVVWQDLNFTTLPEDLLPILMLWFILHSVHEAWMYTFLRIYL